MRRMAGKAHDTKNDFEQCAALRDWKLTHAGGLPSRSSDQAAEKSLANWLSKTLQRRQRALGSAPSQATSVHWRDTNVISKNTGAAMDLRLDWAMVKTKLDDDQGGDDTRYAIML